MPPTNATTGGVPAKAASLLATLAANEAEPGSAADVYEESLQFAPDVASTHASLGRCLVLLGRVREARRHLQRALEIDLRCDDARCQLASILVDEGLVPDALALYASTGERTATPRLLTEYGDLLARLGLADEARGRYEDALRDEQYAPAIVNLGIIHVRRGQPAIAAQCFDRALALDPTCSEATLNLANAYVELGRLDEAEALYEGLWGESDLAGAATLGLSAIAAERGDVSRSRALRLQAMAADRSLAGLCDARDA